MPRPRGILSVPASAILFVEGGAAVVVASGALDLELRRVEIGPIDGPTVRVISGLGADENYLGQPPGGLVFCIAALTPPSIRHGFSAAPVLGLSRQARLCWGLGVSGLFLLIILAISVRLALKCLLS